MKRDAIIGEAEAARDSKIAVQEQEVLRKQKELEATVIKPAEADRLAAAPPSSRWRRPSRRSCERTAWAARLRTPATRSAGAERAVHAADTGRSLFQPGSAGNAADRHGDTGAAAAGLN